jgi:hypothetical protein
MVRRGALGEDLSAYVCAFANVRLRMMFDAVVDVAIMVCMDTGG